VGLRFSGLRAWVALALLRTTCCMDPGQSAATTLASSSEGAPSGSSPNLLQQYEGEPDWPAWFGGHKYLPGRAGYAQRSDPTQVRHFYQEASRIFAGDQEANAEAHAANNAAASGELLRLIRSTSIGSQALVDQIVGPCRRPTSANVEKATNRE